VKVIQVLGGGRAPDGCLKEEGFANLRATLSSEFLRVQRRGGGSCSGLIRCGGRRFDLQKGSRVGIQLPAREVVGHAVNQKRFHGRDKPPPFIEGDARSVGGSRVGLLFPSPHKASKGGWDQPRPEVPPHGTLGSADVKDREVWRWPNDQEHSWLFQEGKDFWVFQGEDSRIFRVSSDHAERMGKLLPGLLNSFGEESVPVL